MTSPSTIRPKKKRFVSRKLLDAAENQLCVICERPMKTETVVPAHLPGSFYGMPAGTRQKTHDWLVAHLCDHCHNNMDTIWRKDAQMRMMALCKTLERLFERGVIIVR